MSKCSKSISDTPGASLIFLAHFDVFCWSITEQKWNLFDFVVYIFFLKKQQTVDDNTSYASVL